MSRGRHEFSRETRKAALRRSGGLCEAEGPEYGLRPDQRCNAPLSFGFQYDHRQADGLGGKPTLENCVCACTRCHKIKTHRHDNPRMQKADRQRAKGLGGIRKSKGSFPSRVDSWGRNRRGNVRDINADIMGEQE